jgi:NADPH:quinone reductase-like Zn-dependent oxidoreductase
MNSAIGNDLAPQMGAFGRYIIAKGDTQIRIPDHISFETAATVGVGLVTLGYALYKVLGLPWPTTETSEEKVQGREILIYGGSTATGTLAIQFARM